MKLVLVSYYTWWLYWITLSVLYFHVSELCLFTTVFTVTVINPRHCETCNKRVGAQKDVLQTSLVNRERGTGTSSPLRSDVAKKGGLVENKRKRSSWTFFSLFSSLRRGQTFMNPSLSHMLLSLKKTFLVETTQWPLWHVALKSGQYIMLYRPKNPSYLISITWYDK